MVRTSTFSLFAIATIAPGQVLYHTTVLQVLVLALQDSINPGTLTFQRGFPSLSVTKLSRTAGVTLTDEV